MNCLDKKISKENLRYTDDLKEEVKDLLMNFDKNTLYDNCNTGTKALLIVFFSWLPTLMNFLRLSTFSIKAMQQFYNQMGIFITLESGAIFQQP